MNTAERLDNAVRYVIIALLFALPFFFIPVAWISVVQAKIVLAALLLSIASILWLLARLLDGTVLIPSTLLLWSACIVPLVYAVSAGIHGFTPTSLLGNGTDTDTLAFVSLCFSSLVLAASVFAGSGEKIVIAIRALMAGTIVLAVLKLVQLIVPALSISVLAGMTGNAFGGWHDFAILIGIGFFLGMTLPANSRYLAYFNYAIAALCGLLLIIANYFDVWIITIAALFIHILVRGYRAHALRSAIFWRKQIVLLVSALVGLFFAFFGSYIVNILPSQIQVVQTEVRPSWQGTLAISQQSLTSPKTFILGTGPNTFTRTWGLYKPADVNTTPFWNMDFHAGVTSIATSFITVGILGLLGWLFLAGTSVWVALRLWILQNEAHSYPIMLSFSIAVMSLLAHHMSGIPGPTISVIFFLSLGLLVALLVGTSLKETLGRSRGNWKSILMFGGYTLLSVVLLLAGSALLRVNAAEILINKGIVVYRATGDSEAASSLIQKSLSIYSKNDRAHRSAVGLGLLSLQKIATQNGDAEAQKAQLEATLKATIQHGLDDVALSGGDYQSWLSLASFYAELAGSKIPGAYENAKGAFEKAREQNPTSPLPYVNLAQLELTQNNVDGALQYLAQATALKNDLALAYYIASQIYVSQKDMKSALQASALAARYAPSDSLAWYNFGTISYVEGNYSDAAQALQRALAIDPQYANAMYVYALSLYHLGDSANAIAVLEALAKLDPSQQVVAQAIANLKAGKPPVAE